MKELMKFKDVKILLQALPRAEFIKKSKVIAIACKPFREHIVTKPNKLKNCAWFLK